MVAKRLAEAYVCSAKLRSSGERAPRSRSRSAPASTLRAILTAADESRSESSARRSISRCSTITGVAVIGIGRVDPSKLVTASPLAYAERASTPPREAPFRHRTSKSGCTALNLHGNDDGRTTGRKDAQERGRPPHLYPLWFARRAGLRRLRGRRHSSHRHAARTGGSSRGRCLRAAHSGAWGRGGHRRPGSYRRVD